MVSVGDHLILWSINFLYFLSPLAPPSATHCIEPVMIYQTTASERERQWLGIHINLQHDMTVFSHNMHVTLLVVHSFGVSGPAVHVLN